MSGLKYNVSSLGFKASPNPCEDFLPAKTTGISSNSAGGPFVKVAVGILKILEFSPFTDAVLRSFLINVPVSGQRLVKESGQLGGVRQPYYTIGQGERLIGNGVSGKVRIGEHTGVSYPPGAIS